jgi:Valyl-tRNA synthetase
LKEISLQAATTGEIKFTPERFQAQYENWMNNLHDWCVSRQIWFGHRIPAWYKIEKSPLERGGASLTRRGVLDNIYVGEEPPTDGEWEQDPDTLDTWFSSGMWTFSTLGWPDNYKNGAKSGDLAKFHPTAVLETGFEILTLWVSRMILMSYYALGEKPFSDVYLHGMILDDKGKKMSKSKGNGIDPLDVIAKYGTDSLRLALLVGNTPGNNARLSMEKVEAQRNFVNKLWNISRFILSTVDKKYYSISTDKFPEAETLSDKWILDRLLSTIRTATAYINQFLFSQAGELLVNFTCDDFSDWYIEASKFENSSKRDEILIYVLKNILKLWHPFMPFVTEAIWKKFNESMLMVESWPKYVEFNEQWVKFSEEGVGEKFKTVSSVIMAIRNARAENKVEPAKKVEAVIYAGKDIEIIKQNEILIKSLKTGISDLKISPKGEKISGAIYAAVGDIEIYLLGAVDSAKEKARLEKEIANLENFIKALNGKLSNQEFVGKAPTKVVEAEKDKLAKAEIELDKLKEQFSKF